MPTFMARHYTILADIFHTSLARVRETGRYPEAQEAGILFTLSFLAEALERDNPNFNRDTFYQHCKPS